MKLGIDGKWALVCAASKGLGKGCAKALVTEGVNVVITARGAEALEATAAELRMLNPAVKVVTVSGDITTAEGRSAALAAAPQIDILINNAGGPPPGDFRNWSRDDWIKAVDANMLTPIELMKAVIDGMCERGFGRIVNITSGAVKAPIDTLGLSNGARSGLTGFVAGLARQPKVASRNVTINGLLPGPQRGNFSLQGGDVLDLRFQSLDFRLQELIPATLIRNLRFVPDIDQTRHQRTKQGRSHQGGVEMFLPTLARGLTVRQQVDENH